MDGHSHSTLAVGLLAYAGWIGIAVAQTAMSTPWPLHNRYIELGRGLHQQNYREQDTGGLTADSALNTETGHQDHISAALYWQTENGWLQSCNSSLTPLRTEKQPTHLHLRLVDHLVYRARRMIVRNKVVL